MHKNFNLVGAFELFRDTGSYEPPLREGDAIGQLFAIRDVRGPVGYFTKIFFVKSSACTK